MGLFDAFKKRPVDTDTVKNLLDRGKYYKILDLLSAKRVVNQTSIKMIRDHVDHLLENGKGRYSVVGSISRLLEKIEEPPRKAQTASEPVEKTISKSAPLTREPDNNDISAGVGAAEPDESGTSKNSPSADFLFQDLFLEKDGSTGSNLKLMAYKSGGNVQQLFSKDDILKLTKPGFLNFLGGTNKTFLLSYVNEGVLGAKLESAQARLQFYPTPNYPYLYFRLAVDDGVRDPLGNPDPVVLEHRIYIHALNYRIFMYELIKADSITLAVVSSGGNVTEFTFPFTMKAACIDELKTVFDYLSEKGTTLNSSNFSSAGAEFGKLESLMTSSGKLQPGASLEQYCDAIASRLELSRKPDRNMWILDEVLPVLAEGAKGSPRVAGLMESMGVSTQQPQTTTDSGLAQTFYHHFNDVRNYFLNEKNETAVGFIDLLLADPSLSQIAANLSEKQSLTRRDNKKHTITMGLENKIIGKIIFYIESYPTSANTIKAGFLPGGFKAFASQLIILVMRAAGIKVEKMEDIESTPFIYLIISNEGTYPQIHSFISAIRYNAVLWPKDLLLPVDPQ